MKFRFADQIISFREKSFLSGIKAVSFEEYSLRGLLGVPESLPETLVLQTFFDFSNWLVLLSTNFSKIVQVFEFERTEFCDLIRPGDRIHVNIEVREFTERELVFEALGKVNGKEIAMLKGCSGKFYPSEDFFDPEDMRTLFSEIFNEKECNL